LKELRLTWPIVVLILFVTTLVLVLLAWLIQTGKASASVLLAPLSSLVVGASAYVVGLMRTPPWMDGSNLHMPPDPKTPMIPTPPPPAWGMSKDETKD